MKINKNHWANPGFLLILILIVFFLKGVFLAALFPIFDGQDESRHYNTIQYLSEPREKNWIIIKKDKTQRDKDLLNTYNFSEEIQKTAQITQNYITRTSEHYDKIRFSENYSGENESEITAQKWDPYNKTYPPDKVGRSGIYHYISMAIEKSLSRENILVRFFSIRIFSIFLGTIAISLTYFIAKTIGFTSKQSLLLTAIISFQPKLSIYFTNINYDALLILMFTAFTLGGVLALKNGFNWKNLSLMIISLLIGIFTKGTTMFLFPVFFGLMFSFYYNDLKNDKKYIIAIIIILIISLWFLEIKYDITKLFSIQSGSFLETLSTLKDYTLNIIINMSSPAESYWGDTGWIRNDYSSVFTHIFWLVGIISIFGLIYFLHSKKKYNTLPEKKYIFFLFGVWFALQFGIRFYDWKQLASGSIETIGTPGRYFFPVITSYMLLIFTGLGALLKKERYLDNTLKIGLILMFIFFMHVLFNNIIPYIYL